MVPKRPQVYFFIIALLLGAGSPAQRVSINPSPEPAQTEAPTDVLGRTTPRGTVLGFLRAGRLNDDIAGAQYLNTRANMNKAAVLAHQLYVVLDARLPARLDQISDRPEGSVSTSSRPDRNVIGTIATEKGTVDVALERVSRGNVSIWLFSAEMLAAVPALYEDVDSTGTEGVGPAFLRTKLGGIPLYAWLVLLVGPWLGYFCIVLLNRSLSAVVNWTRRRLRKEPGLSHLEVLPAPVRLLLLAIAIEWALSAVNLPLLIRQFCWSLARLIAIVGGVWLFIRLDEWGEACISKWQKATSLRPIIRFLRRAADTVAVFAGVLLALHYFGVDLTAALAGLGVGGIAVALAAQKTLENVIAGISLIFDRALVVGDFLKWGDAQGHVESIGLRSTRIRTLDRTVLNVPNGQISTASIEILSYRDKFWLNPTIKLGYETNLSQLRCVLDGVRSLLAKDGKVDQSSRRVRILRFGAFSLDIEVFAYVWARDYTEFLAIQEGILLQIMEVIQTAGTSLALPSQMMYFAANSRPEGTSSEMKSVRENMVRTSVGR